MATGAVKSLASSLMQVAGWVCSAEVVHLRDYKVMLERRKAASTVILPCCHAEDKKHIYLSGKWNSHCDMVKCDLEGNPLPDMEPRRLWTCKEKPANDYYSFTNFAHFCNSSANIRTPLASDSR